MKKHKLVLPMIGLRIRRLLPDAVLLVTLSGCAGLTNQFVGRFTGENVSSQIRATGSPAKAVVLKIWETGTRVNHSPVIGFELEVHAEGRPPWRATTKALVSILAIPRIQPGMELDVFYDPADPSRVALALR